MAGTTDTSTLEPTPTPEEPGPPIRSTTPRKWVRDNLFNTWYNAVLTVVFGGLLLWVVVEVVTFVFFTGRWTIIEVNLTNFMLGRFPRDELYRAWVAIGIVSAASGLAQGIQSGRATPANPRLAMRRVGPLLVLLVVLLSFTRTWVPVAMVVASFAVAAGARVVGSRLSVRRTTRTLVLLWIAAVLGVFLALTGFGGVGWDNWGGLLLTLYLALGGIVLSFPFGVALALGRRSSFPAVRVVCVGYIELIRGVPLITLLFMGAFMLGFFFPPGFSRPSLVTSALVAFVLFTAAYVAEIVRGGLQGVPKGQTEAAQAIGLSPIKTTLLIVLPQALRNVIPALVGQFISLFKDTSLVLIIGLTDLLRVAEQITSQPQFLAQGLQAETLLFASFVYWTFCYTMSRSSQRLEQRLGVGER